MRYLILGAVLGSKVKLNPLGTKIMIDSRSVPHLLFTHSSNCSMLNNQICIEFGDITVPLLM